MERILIVDDSREIARFLSETILPLHNYEGRVAMTGWEGLQLTEQLQPNLILLDFHLPDMTGADVLLQLRQRGQRHTSDPDDGGGL